MPKFSCPLIGYFTSQGACNLMASINRGSHHSTLSLPLVSGLGGSNHMQEDKKKNSTLMVQVLLTLYKSKNNYSLVWQGLGRVYKATGKC